jgi:hypothetical protein
MLGYPLPQRDILCHLTKKNLPPNLTRIFLMTAKIKFLLFNEDPPDVTNKNRAKNFTYFDYQILLINQFSP